MEIAGRWGRCVRCPCDQRHVVTSAQYFLGRLSPSASSGQQCRSMSKQQQILASDAPSKRAEVFASKLLEKVKLRLGFQDRIASSGLGDEELEQDSARGLRTNNMMAKKSMQNEEVDIEQTALQDYMLMKSMAEEEALVEDKLPLDQREKDIRDDGQQRPNLTSPGFSFSAAGHLFPYHLGVCQCLIDNGYLTDNTPLAGSSAGALVCAVVAGGLPMAEALCAAKEVSEDCRMSGTAFRVGAVLRRIMEKYLPEDAHTRVNGRIRVAVTQVFRQPRGLLVDQFHSKEDLIDALHTSCFIPGYFAPRPVTVFRNRVCIDGGFTLFMPPTAASETVRICAFSASTYNLKGIEISPDCNPTKGRLTNQQLLNLAFQPADDDALDELYRSGYEDALCWVKQRV